MRIAVHASGVNLADTIVSDRRAIPVPATVSVEVLLKNCAVVRLDWGTYLTRNLKVVRDSFSKLLGWYQEGVLKLYLSQTFPLEQAASVLSVLTERKSIGKVVLTTNNLSLPVHY